MRGRWTHVLVPILSALALDGLGCGKAELIKLHSTSRTVGKGGAGGVVSGGAGDSGGTSIVFGGNGGTSSIPDCSGYACNQIDCPGASTTSLSGTIYDPAGKVPLYDVVVYVPSTALDPVPEGVTCDVCNGRASGRPVAATLSDASGHFLLKDVPPGRDIPVAIQVGKWRRQVSIASVAPCVENAVTDSDLTRLPRNRTEGHIPQIGISTGHADALECLMRKIGIDDTEFTTDSGAGRVHMYVGCGNSDYTPPRTGADHFGDGTKFPPSTSLWGDPTELARYDILLFSCEGNTCSAQKTTTDLANIKEYADRGGRLFLDHTHYYWLNHNADSWQSSADYVGSGGDIKVDPFPTQIDSSFPKGSAFSDWLINVGATSTPGELDVHKVQFSVRDAYPPKTQQWIYTHDNPQDSSGHAVEYMTMNTPVEYAGLAGAGGAGGASSAGGAAGAGGSSAANVQCGRVVYTDLHVATVTKDFSDQDTPFPNGCVDPKPALTPQEKALEFMFFDLSSCVQPERKVPTPPIVVIK